MPPVRLLIPEDHAIVRQGIRISTIFSHVANITVVAEVTDGWKVYPMFIANSEQDLHDSCRSREHPPTTLFIMAARSSRKLCKIEQFISFWCTSLFMFYTSTNTDRSGIAVDHSQEEATSRILPSSNLLSSCKTAWNGMYLEYHYAPPHETPEHYPLQHVIAIQTEGTVRAERRLNGQFRREHISAGDVCIVPAQTRHWIYSGGEQGLLLLSLDPTFLARVAHETIHPDRIELIPQFAHPDPLLYQLGLSLKTAVQADAVESQFYAQSLGVALTAHLLQYYTIQNHLLLDLSSNVPAPQLQEAINYIHAHLTEGLSLEAIASVAGMSQYHFTRVFKQAIGITPWQYVVQQRIEAAKRLLAKRELSITQISQQLGFSTQTQFSNFFRKHTGITSTEYRQAL